MKAVAVIMAGGIGSQLWPRSTEKHPKPFVHLLGEGTMIQNTFARMLPLFKPEEIFVVTTAQTAAIVLDQVPALKPGNIIVEPFGRDTAACIALSATTIEARTGGDTVMVALPSDHLIYNVREFHQSMELAIQIAAERNSIAMIGLQPTRAETSFGYIQVDEDPGDLGDFYEHGVRCVSTFAEKPDYATAQRFFESGDFLWNSGIYAARISTLWDKFDKHLPDHGPLFRLMQKHITRDTFPKVLENVYKQMRRLSIDYGVMEKVKDVYVVKSSFGWSDVGTWDELYRLSMKDAKNNVIEGDVIAIDTTNCLVSSNGRMIGMVDVEDLIVIDADNSILICRRGSSQNISNLIDFMRRKQITRYL